jgi:hypothetical protein
MSQNSNEASVQSVVMRAVAWFFTGADVFGLWCRYLVIDSSGNENVDLLRGCICFPVFCVFILCWMRGLCILDQEMK